MIYTESVFTYDNKKEIEGETEEIFNIITHTCTVHVHVHVHIHMYMYKLRDIVLVNCYMWKYFW